MQVGKYNLCDWYLRKSGSNDVIRWSRDWLNWIETGIYVDIWQGNAPSMWIIRCGSSLPFYYAINNLVFSSLEEAQKYVDTILNKYNKLQGFW